MTTYNVNIDATTMIDMLMDRMEVWVKSYEPSYPVYEGFITDLVEGGCFEGTKDFDPMMIVDNLYINDTTFYDTVEDAIEDGYREDQITYQSDEGVIVWAC